LNGSYEPFNAAESKIQGVEYKVARVSALSPPLYWLQEPATLLYKPDT